MGMHRFLAWEHAGTAPAVERPNRDMPAIQRGQRVCPAGRWCVLIWTFQAIRFLRRSLNAGIHYQPIVERGHYRTEADSSVITKTFSEIARLWDRNNVEPCPMTEKSVGDKGDILVEFRLVTTCLSSGLSTGASHLSGCRDLGVIACRDLEVITSPLPYPETSISLTEGAVDWIKCVLYSEWRVGQISWLCLPPNSALLITILCLQGKHWISALATMYVKAKNVW